MKTLLRILVVAVLFLFGVGTLPPIADARHHKGKAHKANHAVAARHHRATTKATARKTHHAGRHQGAVAVKSGKVRGHGHRLSKATHRRGTAVAAHQRRAGKQLAHHSRRGQHGLVAHQVAGKHRRGRGRNVQVAHHRRGGSAAVKAVVAAHSARDDDDHAVAPEAGGAALSDQALRRKLSARSAIVMDARTGQLLYAQAPDLPGQPASTLKILTALISLESLDSDELVPTSQRAAAMPKSKVFLRPGAQYPADDLINAALMASANDACVALAEKIGGSEPGFARLMTAKARSLGANTTVCKNASGLTASGQQSTARDLATMFAIAMRNREFAAKLARTEVTTQEGKILRSHNRALWQVEGAQGGKTGYTDLARHTYVGKFSRPEGELVVALMGSNRMWPDISNLVKYGFAEKGRQNQKTAAGPAPSLVKLAENRPLLSESRKLTR